MKNSIVSYIALVSIVLVALVPCFSALDEAKSSSNIPYAEFNIVK